MKIAFFEMETKETLAILDYRIPLERFLFALLKKSKRIKIGQRKQEIYHFAAGKIIKYCFFQGSDQKNLAKLGCEVPLERF